MNGQLKRVLIADSEQRLRQDVITLLHQAGYVVHQTADGLEALAELKRWHFDALLAGYRLPRLDGVRLLLLSRIMWPEIPVFLLSADLAELPLTLKKQGASALVSTPFAPDELLGALRLAIWGARAEDTVCRFRQVFESSPIPLH